MCVPGRPTARSPTASGAHRHRHAAYTDRHPEPEQTTLTVAEYAAWCAERSERPELLDNVRTYGDLKQLIRTELAHPGVGAATGRPL